MPSIRPSIRLALPSALLFAPILASAHPGHGPEIGLAAGFAHPFGGFDHLLAMIAVGLWAAQLGGRARWIVPGAFVGAMALGGALGMAGLQVPFVEQGIVASLLVLGVLIVAALRMPPALGALLVGLFALFHGYAHGAEMPAAGGALGFGLGFVAATATLHLAGLALGTGLIGRRLEPVARAAGLLVVAAGAMLALA